MEVQQDWWLNPLAEDIHQTLRMREMQLPTYAAQSPQLAYRRYLVDWLAVICDEFKLCATAKHLAVMLMDYFMDSYDIDQHLLKLVALGSLLVAAKFEEQEIQTPKCVDLNRCVAPESYTKWEYMQMELTLLKLFNWNISLPTAAHFIGYFLTVGVTSTDLHGETVIADCDRAATYLQKYTDYFLEICLQEHSYREYLPSMLAAAAIAASRICLQIQPPWSQQLQSISKYSITELMPIVQKMLRTHQVDEKAGKQQQAALVSVCTPPPTPSPPKQVLPCTMYVTMATTCYTLYTVTGSTYMASTAPSTIVSAVLPMSPDCGAHIT